MFSYIWPIALVVLSNVVYQICAKSIPRDIDPFASLTVTYAVGAIASAIIYYVMNKGGHLLREYSHLNWSPFVLGIVIVGLEVGGLAGQRGFHCTEFIPCRSAPARRILSVPRGSDGQ